MPIWLITSLSLPVARTTSRLMALLVKDLWRNPFGLASLATLAALSAIAVLSSGALLAVRTRRTSRRASIS